MLPRAQRAGRLGNCRRGLAILTLAGLMLGLLAPPASADGFRLLQLAGAYIKWGEPRLGSGATVRYAILDGDRRDAGAINCRAMAAPDRLLAGAGISRTAFEERLRSALALWQAAAGITFVPAASAAEADIVVGAQAVPRGIAYANVQHEPQAGSRFARLGQATICLNPEVAWRSGGEAGGAQPVYELGRVLTHEIGHAIGLDHPGPRGEMMAFSYQEDLDRLTDGDIAGIVTLYGPPARR